MKADIHVYVFPNLLSGKGGKKRKKEKKKCGIKYIYFHRQTRHGLHIYIQIKRNANFFVKNVDISYRCACKWVFLVRPARHHYQHLQAAGIIWSFHSPHSLSINGPALWLAASQSRGPCYRSHWPASRGGVAHGRAYRPLTSGTLLGLRRCCQRFRIRPIYHYKYQYTATMNYALSDHT